MSKQQGSFLVVLDVTQVVYFKDILSVFQYANVTERSQSAVLSEQYVGIVSKRCI